MNKKILIVELHHRLGGGQIHSLSMYKMMLENGLDAQILVPHNTQITKRLEMQGLPCIKTKILKFAFIKPLYKLVLAAKLFFVCKKHKIDIVHCNKDIELCAAKLIAKRLNLKIVFTRHVALKPLKVKRVKGIDGFIGVNPEIVTRAQNLNLSIKNFQFIPPFFDEESYLKYSPNQSKESFFEQNFGIKLKTYPLLCIVANLSDRKNQGIAIEAVAKLKNEYNMPVQLALAGVGSQKLLYKNLAKRLGIEDLVYFLGFTDKAVDLMYHSDIKILPSKVDGEGLPITIMEAALIKKPIIGTFKTGTECVVKHEQTGLLFNFDDAQTLALHIQRLIAEPEFAKILGQNACDFVINNLSNKVKFEKLFNFYQQL